jgi:hypothetical protein
MILSFSCCAVFSILTLLSSPMPPPARRWRASYGFLSLPAPLPDFHFISPAADISPDTRPSVSCRHAFDADIFAMPRLSLLMLIFAFMI